MKSRHIILLLLLIATLPLLAQNTKEVKPTVDYGRTPREYILGGIAVSGVQNYDEYLLIGLSLRLSDKNKSQKTAEENTRIRFYDERKNLKLVVLANNILYIEAEENYVRIYYTENGKTKDYLLRSSMKKIEELCQLNGLTRCHRSYFVNAAHVRVLAKDKDGFIYAELENLEKRIPVTKRYYENLSNLL